MSVNLNPPPRPDSDYDGIVALHRRVQAASGEDFEFALREMMQRAEADPQAVARAIAAAALPTG